MRIVIANVMTDDRPVHLHHQLSLVWVGGVYYSVQGLEVSIGGVMGFGRMLSDCSPCACADEVGEDFRVVNMRWHVVTYMVH